MSRIRDKYPKLTTRTKFALQFANDVPHYKVVDGLIQETGKLAFPPLKPDEFCKILVDIGYLVKHGKGSPWKWIREYKINREYREYPYQPTNVINKTNEKENR